MTSVTKYINKNELELEDLYLTDTQFLKIVDEIEDFTSITKISLCDNPKITDLQPLTKFTFLSDLYLSDIGVSDFGCLSELKYLTSFRSIDEHSSFKNLELLTNLQDLSIVNNDKLKSIAFVKNLPNLEHISFSYSKIIDDMDVLVNLTKLKILGLSFTGFGYGKNDFKMLTQLPNLEELSVEGHEYDPSQLIPLSYCKKLHTLRLNPELKSSGKNILRSIKIRNPDNFPKEKERIDIIKPKTEKNILDKFPKEKEGTNVIKPVVNSNFNRWIIYGSIIIGFIGISLLKKYK